MGRGGGGSLVAMVGREATLCVPAERVPAFPQGLGALVGDDLPRLLRGSPTTSGRFGYRRTPDFDALADRWWPRDSQR